MLAGGISLRCIPGRPSLAYLHTMSDLLQGERLHREKGEAALLFRIQWRGFTERKGKLHCFLESSLPLWPVRGRWNPAHLQEKLVFCLEGRCHKEFKSSFKSSQTLKPASWPLASEAGQGDLAFTIPVYSVLSSLYPEKWFRYKERHDFVSLNHPCLHVLKL